MAKQTIKFRVRKTSNGSGYILCNKCGGTGIMRDPDVGSEKNKQLAAKNTKIKVKKASKK